MNRSNSATVLRAAVCLPFVSAGLLFSTQVVADRGTDDVLTSLPADDLRIVQRGEDVYRRHCASCHGNYLEGQPDWRRRNKDGKLPAPPHDASGHTWHHDDDLLFEITKFGPAVVIGDPGYESDMPAFEGILADTDIVAALAFIKNSWPEQQRQWQSEVNVNVNGSEAGFGSADGLGRSDNRNREFLR